MTVSVAHYHVDANILLRFIRDDHKSHSPKAAHLIKSANAGSLLLEVSAVVVAEVFYILKSVYKGERSQIARLLAQLLNSPAFRLAESRRILDTLTLLCTVNTDFADAYLAATAQETGFSIASFDRDLDKFKNVKRYEPQ